MNELDLSGPPPQPKTLAEAQEVINALWSALQSMQALQQRVTELEEQLGIDSSTSSKPPSSDSPQQRAKRKRRPRSDKSQGAQPGHKKHERSCVPVDQVNKIETFLPPSHCDCGSAIELEEAPSVRHQVFDLPKVRYHVTEYQLYEGRCGGCGDVHKARFPSWVPSGQMGAGLIAWIGLLAGEFHLTIRGIQRFLNEQWSLNFSVGAISQAQGKLTPWLGGVYQQIGEHVRQAEIAHADETRHYRHTEQRWLWCLTTPLAVYLLVHCSRGMNAAMSLLGRFDGVLVTDHYSGYNAYPSTLRQLCWSHAIRRLERIGRRVGRAGEIGRRLTLLAQAVIRTRHRYDKQQLDEVRYQRRMQRLRQSVQIGLERGTRLRSSTRTKNQCRHLLKDEAMYWTFLSDDRIPLTNNIAEQSLRGYVIWRKLSFASQSYRGDQFRPMIMTVMGTARRLKLSGIGLLRAIAEQGLRGDPVTVQLPLPDPKTPQIANR